MRASSDRRAADVGGVRASDAERDQAIGELRDRFVEGRLSQETFLYRMDAALRAKDHGDLAGLFADLPRTVRYPRGNEPAQDWPARARPADARSADDELGLRRLRRLALGRLSSARQAAARRLSVLPARPPQLCLPPEAGEQQKFTIGRESACDFTLADQSVSRWHARLDREDGGWLLCDLGSTNGTRLNGWRVTSGVRIRPGDRVSFGAVTFVLTDRPTGAG
jgi:FHA domain/Domain of unknown function (DUF1707)